MQRITVFGAGAIGGFLAARLEAAGTPTAVVARGPHLEAMRREGLKLIEAGREIVVRPQLIDDVSRAGPQDVLFITLKAHQLEAALPQLGPLIGERTLIVAAINGIPWWYTYRMGGPFDGRPVLSVDPSGRLWRELPPAQTVGCIVQPATEVTQPGVITHEYGDRFTLGEPDGSRSERITELSRTLIAAGLKAPVRNRIRDDLWIKLWGNMAFNPISALTGGRLDEMIADEGVLAVVRAMMVEAAAVGGALGVRLAIELEARIDGARQVGAHKTSMAQDLERGRPLETEALLGAVVELAGWVGVATPLSAAILALVRQRARTASAAKA
ncbi:MAG: 2-dehydropantoate 2-reductase [Bauldia sp.]